MIALVALMACAGTPPGTPAGEVIFSRAASARAAAEQLAGVLDLAPLDLPSGIEGGAPLVVRFAKDGVMLVGAHVRTPRDVDAWLARGRPLPGEAGWIVRAADPIVTCARTERTLWCQLGLGPRGTAPLAESGGPSPPDSGSWQVTVSGALMRDWLVDWHVNLAQADARFMAPEDRAEHLARAVRRGRARASLLGELRGISAHGSRGGALVRALISSELDARVSARAGRVDPRLVGWTDGPALATAYGPFVFDVVPRWLGAHAIRVDPAQGFAMAVFGLDPFCKSARNKMEDPATDVGAALPTALAVLGVRTSTRAEPNVHILQEDAIVVVGLGRGAATAGRRRAAAARPHAVPASLLLRAHLDLRALRAAMQPVPPRPDRPALEWLRRLQTHAQDIMDVSGIDILVERSAPGAIDLLISRR